MRKKKTAAIVLFAATTTSAIAIAEPSKPAPPTVQPLTLPTGAPACGNVMGKSYGPPKLKCVSMSALVTAAVESIREIRETVAVFDVLTPRDRPALTLVEEGRPRS